MFITGNLKVMVKGRCQVFGGWNLSELMNFFLSAMYK